MENASVKEAIAEMEIPKSLSETLFVAAIDAIIIVFVLLAVFNLVFLTALAASIIWLLLVGLLVRKWCRDAGGVRQFVINHVGEFAPRQIAEMIQPDTGAPVLCFGYQLFKHRYYYLQVRCAGIKSVDWGPGQASALAGRDANDWRVALWFDAESVTMNWTSHKYGMYKVGPPRRKEQTEALGGLLIDLLRRAGVAVAQTDHATLRSLIGKHGVVSHPLRPLGTVAVGGNEYPAHGSKGYIEKSTEVEVVEVRGLSLRVQPIEARSAISGNTSGKSLSR